MRFLAEVGVAFWVLAIAVTGFASCSDRLTSHASTEPSNATVPAAREVFYAGWAGPVYASCDALTGNLIYVSQQALAVVPGGCRSEGDRR